MHRLNHPTHAPMPRRQRGISLIESLVAVVVMALGILGIVGVQMRTLTDTSTAVRRAQAIRLIEDLGERMKTNPNALANLNTYVSNFAAIPTVGSCATGCNPTQLATYDLAVWKRTVQENLPMGKASIFVPPAESGLPAGQGRQLGVMIAWRENERVSTATHTTAEVDAYKNDIDSTKFFDGTVWKEAGGATACPADHTCHLQYIIAPSRCAPYSPGGVTTYYCPGV